jgi:ABC-type amino acid transport substrate-binding protein
MSACQTVATNDAELAASRKEFLLAQSGFKVVTVTTPKQQQAINALAQYRVSAVVSGEIVLRVSHWDEGQDLCRKTKAIHRL